jgi:hypothetical protein
MTTASSADRTTEQLIPLAGQLVRAVHTNSPLGVRAALHDAAEFVGDPLTAAHLLITLLAAMCPDDAPAEELLGWRINPTEYHRLRSLGVPSREAAELAARVSHYLHGRKSA